MFDGVTSVGGYMFFADRHSTVLYLLGVGRFLRGCCWESVAGTRGEKNWIPGQAQNDVLYRSVMLDLIQHPVLAKQIVVDITPARIRLFNQLQLPSPTPVFDLFLASDRLTNVVMDLKPD